jgi:hypothetical protein
MSEFSTRKKLLSAGALLALGGGSIAGCGIGETGYSTDQKAQFEAVIKPVAVEITTKALADPEAVVGLSSDSKSFLVSKGLGDQGPHESVLISITKTSEKPDPNQVTSIVFDEWVTDPKDPTKLTISSSLTLDGEGDHINTDQYWAVDAFETLGDDDKSNDINLTNLPRTSVGSNKIDMSWEMDTVKLILGQAKTAEVEVFGQ